MKETLTLELSRIHGNTGSRADWNLSGGAIVAEYTPGFVQRSHLETGTRGSAQSLQDLGFLPQNSFSRGPTLSGEMYTRPHGDPS
jgi:hypothetical protein